MTVTGATVAMVVAVLSMIGGAVAWVAVRFDTQCDRRQMVLNQEREFWRSFFGVDEQDARIEQLEQNLHAERLLQARNNLATIRRAIHHEVWDEDVQARLRTLGEEIGPPPPLLPVEVDDAGV